MAFLLKQECHFFNRKHGGGSLASLVSLNEGSVRTVSTSGLIGTHFISYCIGFGFAAVTSASMLIVNHN
jgi:hypothetical protein